MATFSITVKNQGNADATDIDVIDYVPTGMAVAATQPSMPTTTDLGAAVTITETAPTYTIDALDAGDSVTFDITLEITDLGMPEFRNAAEISDFLDADGNPTIDVDSTPDTSDTDDVIDEPTDPDNPANSHNDIDYDPDNDGNVHEPTPGDEDDHDVEVLVIVYEPSIDIEKDTNGVQADTGTGPLIIPGNAVEWTFVVTNDGNVDLADVVVGDTVTTDNGTTSTAISCDWLNSSDPLTPARNLSVGESVTCTSTAPSNAQSGQYRNEGDVTGTPVADATTADPDNPVRLQDLDGNDLADVVDDDPSAYFGPEPSIDIEKDTNGNQADVIADQDADYAVGDAITWTFEVENTGNVDLSDVEVNDSTTIDNLTTSTAISCDWPNSSDPLTPARNLSVGETVTCTATAVGGAQAGQYGNLSDVTGTPVADATTADPDNPVRLQDEFGGDLADVTDDDPSHYFAIADPSIDIEKDTNGNQADVIADQDTLAIGTPITWTFEVENTGDVDLDNVVVTDDVTLDNLTTSTAITCDWPNSSDPLTPADRLSVGETVTCTATSPSAALAGQYRNDSEVNGTPVDDATAATPNVLQDVNGVDLPDVFDLDPSHYFGAAIPSIDIEKDTNGFDADTGTGPLIIPGNAVEWTFVVANDGNVDLADVVVGDTVTEDNGTTSTAISCDWPNSSDPLTPARNLSVNETVTCTATAPSTAQAGQYRNLSDVAGTPVADAVTADPDNPVRLQDIDGNDLPDATDTDPSAYFGPEPSIDIEKDTNGNQADTLAAQDADYAVGDAITWTFEVENTGNVDLSDVVVSDSIVIDNLTTSTAITCDWPNSSDPLTPARNLSAGETVTCTATAVGGAQAGQYGNLSDVVGTPVADATTADPDNPVRLQDEFGGDLADVTDDDPSHYFAIANPSIDIEKDTNGNQADVIADQDTLAIGAAVTWTFEVENTGDVDLDNVVVTDDVTLDNGTTSTAITCDWPNSSDPLTPADRLSVGETVTCTATAPSNAVAGQYRNDSEVTGDPVDDATDPAPTPLVDVDGNDLPDVFDLDPSHYFGAAVPSIDIEKDTNGVQADSGTGPLVVPGNAVTWTFEVENTGNVDLSDVVVGDTVTEDNGTTSTAITCDWVNSSDPLTPDRNLSVGETVTCTATAPSTAQAGQYRNLSDVSGTPVADATTADPDNPVPLQDIDGNDLPDATDTDPSAYFGPEPSIDIEKDTNGNQADTHPAQHADFIRIGDPDGRGRSWSTNTGDVDL